MTHYFDSSPSTQSQSTDFEIVVNGTTITMASQSGVFSARGLDKGTSVLLDWALNRDLPTIPDDSLLCDLGCGSGAIALTLAQLYPRCTVHAVDINSRARQLCVDNAKRNNITNIVVLDPDQRDPNNRYELIWSNPPIRIGKTALHGLIDTWLGQLNENGIAHLVVSKNLGADSLITWLNTQNFSASKLASSKGFRVIKAVLKELDKDK